MNACYDHPSSQEAFAIPEIAALECALVWLAAKALPDGRVVRLFKRTILLKPIDAEYAEYRKNHTIYPVNHELSYLARLAMTDQREFRKALYERVEYSYHKQLETFLKYSDEYYGDVDYFKEEIESGHFLNVQPIA